MQTGHLALAVLCVAGFVGCAAPLGEAAAAKRHMLSLCTEPNFRGKCFNFTGSEGDLKLRRHLQQDFSNVRIEAGRGFWQLCSETRFTGRWAVATESIPDLRATDLRTGPRSVR